VKEQIPEERQDVVPLTTELLTYLGIFSNEKEGKVVDEDVNIAVF